MIFQDIPTGESVFVDANAFIYYFASDPVFGPACDQLLRRIENQDVTVCSSTPPPSAPAPPGSHACNCTA